MIAVDQIRGPRWPAGGRHDRVETEPREHGVEPFAAREPLAPSSRLAVRPVRQRPLPLSHFEDLLAEKAELLVLVRLVEADEFRQGVRGGAGAELGQVGV